MQGRLVSQSINLDRTVISSRMGVGDGGGRHKEGGMRVVTLEAASGTGLPMERGVVAVIEVATAVVIVPAAKEAEFEGDSSRCGASYTFSRTIGSMTGIRCMTSCVG